ncbi:unnamed protein product [Malus baccata var. baccata]
MKSLCIIIFCFLITCLYLSSHKINSASRASLPGRRPARKLNGESEASKVKEIPLAIKHANSNNDLDELVYHIDYRGVTTHPNPTPRHPTP